MSLVCSETALGQCFHFGFRVGEIMETFETILKYALLAVVMPGLTWYTCPSTIPDRFQVSPGITTARKACFQICLKMETLS